MSTPNAFLGFLGLGDGLDSYAAFSGVTLRFRSLPRRLTVGESKSSAKDKVPRGCLVPVLVTDAVNGEETPILLVRTDEATL